MTGHELPDYVLTCGATTAGTLALTPPAMILARRLGVVDHPSPHKFHRSATPYLGGIAVAAAVLGAAIIPGSMETGALIVFTSAGLMAAVGALDDWKVLPAGPRLLAQAAGAAALWSVHVRVTATGFAPVDFLLTAFVVLTIVNAVNLLDNMDGLASGSVAIAAGFFFVVAYSQGQRLVSLEAAVVMGGCLGFLPYNFGMARVFLGDAGTMFLGFLLATLALQIDVPTQSLLGRVAIPWLILGVPLFDTSLVVLSRWRRGRPVFHGGTDHSSHRLVAIGLTTRQAAVVTYTAGVIGGLAALAILEARRDLVTVTIVVAAIAAAAFLLVVFEGIDLGCARMREGVGPVARSGVA